MNKFLNFYPTPDLKFEEEIHLSVTELILEIIKLEKKNE